VDRVRSLIPRDIKPIQVTYQRRSHTLKSGRKRKASISYPLVKEIFIKQAVLIGEEAFPQIVVLENSMRTLIEQTLSTIRTDWWTALVPAMVQNNVRRTINKEKKYPYREKRGNSPLMYCNFADLKEIVITNPVAFRNIIVDPEWFKAKMDEVYMARNNLAHSILLSQDDMVRIALFYKDWARLLETANIK
jgi:hypothetical protein